MDTMRGSFGSLAGSDGYGADEEDETSGQAPPAAIGQDERRMQVRAYNHWASLLEDRHFPGIEDLEPENLPDFGPYSVLLDFSSGIENPGISYLGHELAGECDAVGVELGSLADVPSRSLLTRITDHYMQILANQAPIGFEAEFVNQRGATIAYRGILLPFSSDDDTIDFIFGVINWKELADAQASDELLLEIDQVLEAKPAPKPATARGSEAPLTDWADGPGAAPANDLDDDDPDGDGARGSDSRGALPAARHGLPAPSFGFGQSEYEGEDEGDEDEADEDIGGPAFGSLLNMPFSNGGAEKAPLDLGEPVENAAFLADAAIPDLAGPSVDPSEMALGDWLSAARAMAAAARSSEDRTRGALYEAIGRAYDFSLAAARAPEEFEALLGEAGLKMQDRAPMTPVVKLVFGADYDKTRLTEYSAALSHAHRLDLPRGALGTFLGNAEGGLKGVVKAERKIRREEAGKTIDAPDAPRKGIARKLRALPQREFGTLAAAGSEFALVMIRRNETGEVALLGEVPEDPALIERAARRLIV